MHDLNWSRYPTVADPISSRDASKALNRCPAGSSIARSEVWLMFYALSCRLRRSARRSALFNCNKLTVVRPSGVRPMTCSP